MSHIPLLVFNPFGARTAQAEQAAVVPTVDQPNSLLQTVLILCQLEQLLKLSHHKYLYSEITGNLKNLMSE